MAKRRKEKGGLVLTRKLGEAVVVESGGAGIVITIKEIRRNQVRIMVDAPGLDVWRAEILSEDDPRRARAAGVHIKGAAHEEPCAAAVIVRRVAESRTSLLSVEEAGT